MTGEDGTFELTGLPEGVVTLEVYLYGDPSSGDPVRKEVAAGSQDVAFVIDLGEQLAVRVEDGAFVPGGGLRDDVIYLGGFPPSRAMLFVKIGDEILRWWAAVEDGALRFRRIKTGHPWVLYIPWSSDVGGTSLMSGPRLEAGERRVVLEPGLRITGTVAGVDDRAFGSGTGPPRRGVIARRGPVEVRRGFSMSDGSFSFPPLPAGNWEVTVFDTEPDRGDVAATVEVEAGAFVRLEPVPVSREAWWRAREHRR